MSSPIDIARATVADRGLLPDGQPAVLLVSGGADSTAMLRMFAEGAFGDRPLRVVHVDHMLRGEVSGADAAFVADLAARLGIECRVAQVDVAAYAASAGLNLEDAGRRVRYRIAEEELDALAAASGGRRGSGAIVTAHTLDDRIETFFMRALAGGGTGALSAIPYRRGRIVRPLLDVERSALRDYLGQLGQEWREDASNEDTSRTRAAVRHALLPAAEAVSPAFRTTMRRTLGLLAEDDELLSGMAEAFGRDFALIEPGVSVAFDRDLMLTLSHPMARRAVRSAVHRAFPEASRLEFDHVNALVEGLSDPTFARDLPDGLRAEGQYDTMVVLRTGDHTPSVAPSLLEVPGKAQLGEAGSIAAEIADPRDTSGTPDSVVIDAGDVEFFTIDGVRDGDRITPLGMSGRRKLSDLLIDEKVPRRMRSAVPVVRHEGSIVWVAGVRMSEEYRVTPETQRAVRLTWDREDG